MSDKDPKKRLTRAEKRAMNKAAYAKRAEDAKAKKDAKAKPDPNDIMNSPMAKFLPPQEETAPDPAPASRTRTGRRAHTSAGEEKALIGEVLAQAEGFIPEEPASPTTVRYDTVDHEPTEETRAVVMALKLAGQTDDDIALYLKISDRLLRRHYVIELEEAVARAGGEIALKVTKLAMAGDPKIVRWFAERRLPGFSTRPSVVAGVQVNTSGGPPEGGVRGGVRQIVPPPPNERGHLEVRMIIGIGDKDIS